ncbi:sigma-54-dependent transcriptional regulator [Alkalihalobacterium elongatum]|uniref:sigma-54-dependent transcriptional regulator n=1 Tax=Alkalihalobacterium elongatum TaxID=2675466 RepID=UPI001C1F3339|nr:sigma-54 dependent transcriptional regulator [Alkalihalobacterium elongatum]
MTRLLVVDDEYEIGNFLSYLFTKKGYEVSVARTHQEVLDHLEQKDFHLAMVDLKMPDTNGLQVLQMIKKKMPSCKVIIMTGYSTVKTAVDAIKNGANDYIEKPFDDIDELEKHIDNLLHIPGAYLDEEINKVAQQIGMVTGHTASMNTMLKMAYKFAGKNINILLEGETGTGKEVLARFIHEASHRVQNPFIGLNCGALTETLLESELFGHEKGAFTGAGQQRKGLFEIASHGTLFLDEIAEASPAIQVKLLRVLETREFMRVGSEHTLRTNARIIAASHANLHEAVRNGSFREDLLYRLDVVKLQIPPLRERKEDLPLLIQKLLEKYPGVEFSNDTMGMMENHYWPGNIRELSNVVTRAVALAEGETTVITPDYLPVNIRDAKKVIPIERKVEKTDSSLVVKDFSKSDLKHFLDGWNAEMVDLLEGQEELDLELVKDNIKRLEEVVEKAFVYKALRDTLGNRKEASKKLNITVRKLRYILNEKGHG